MAYLPDWDEDNRVKITIDNTNIDSDLTHFPVPVVLGTSVGQSNQDVSEIFDALVYDDVDDDFTGDDDDPPNPDLWVTDHDTGVEPDSGSTMTIQSNALLIDINAEESYPFVTSIFKLSGDFDIQVDVDSSESPSTNKRLGFAIGQDNTNPISGVGDWAGIYWQNASLVHHRTYNKDGTGSASSSLTKCRFVRTGSALTMYNWNGSSWVSYSSDSSFGTEDMFVRMFVRTVVSGTFDVAFDNFTVTSGTIIWSENTHPNRKKIAITKDDGTTQIYGEIEHWDSINEKAVIWVSKHDLVLDNADTTDLYLYYDPTQDNNNNFIGDIAQENTVTNITGDNFTGINDDSPDPDLWNVYHDDKDSGDSSGTHKISSNALAFSLVTTKTFPVTQSNYKLSGNFDIQVDFDLTIPSPDSEWAAGLSIGAGNTDIFEDSKYAFVARFTTGSGPYLSGTYNGTDPKEGSDDTSGKFRFVRSGDELVTYYWGGSSWVTYLTDSSYGDHDVYVKLFTQMWGTTTTLNGTFDNFVINSGTVKYNPSQRVWDDNFKAVYHMAQDPSGGTDAILDSTANQNHGTSSGSMTSSDLVSGEIGKALNFDGVDDQIEIAADVTLNDLAIGEAFTIESVIYPRTVGEDATGRIVTKRPLVPNTAGGWLFFMDSVASLGFQSMGSAAEAHQRGSDNAITLNSHFLCCLTYDDNDSRKGDILAGSVEIAYDTDTAAVGANSTDDSGPLMIGNTAAGGQDRSFDGLIEMVRLSNSIRLSSWIKATDYALKDDLLTFDFEDITTALIDMALDIKAYQDYAQDIKSDLIVAAYAAEDTQMSLAAYLQHVSDLKTDVSVYGTIMQDMIIDAFVAGISKENIKTDFALYSQGINNTKLDLQTWQSIIASFPLDLKVAVEIREDGELDLSTAYVILEDLKQFMVLTQSIVDSEASLDFSVGDGIIFKNTKLDFEVGDGNKKEDVGLNLVLVATAPIFKAIYGLHLESAIKEIT